MNFVVILVGLFFGLGLVYQSRLGLSYQSPHLFFQCDLKGVVHQLDLFAKKIPSPAVILINDFDFADRLGVPLKYIHRFDVATIRQDNQLTLPFLNDLIDRAKRHHQNLVLVAVNPLSPTIRKHLICEPLFFYPMTVKMLKNSLQIKDFKES